MTALLEIDGLTKRFGGFEALSDVSFSAERGSIVGLIGPNGAGKTTCFNAISGLLKTDSGSVRYDGQDITSAAPERRARLGIGRSFQNLGLIGDQTVLTNLLAAQHVSAGYGILDVFVRPRIWWSREAILKSRALEAARVFGLSTVLDDNVSDLPFAFARFAELACVLVEEPQLMLLDEPTTGLDGAEVEILRYVLNELRAAGTTILVVAHDVRFVMDLCDPVVVLAEGRVLTIGRPLEVANNPKVIEAYLGKRL